MNVFMHCRKRIDQFYIHFFLKRSYSWESIGFLLNLNPFWIKLFYFSSLSCLGFCILFILKPRIPSHKLDLFFTSVSASTASSLSSVEMEDFSQNQLITLTFLMFCGNEFFISYLGLLLRSLKLDQTLNNGGFFPAISVDQTNLDFEISMSQICVQKKRLIRLLGFVALGILAIIHILGAIVVLLYVTYDSSARNLLKEKGINRVIFSVFLTVSTCSRCGFVPTNENMIVFRKNTWLLLILIPQIIASCLFLPFLRFFIWVLGKLFRDSEYFKILLENLEEIGRDHLFSKRRSWSLAGTFFGLVFVQFVLFCSMEWRSVSLEGLNKFEKFVGVLFQCMNTRHTGEYIVDLSLVSPAVLVLFVFMMYLPPNTTFFPSSKHKEDSTISVREETRRSKIWKILTISDVSYLIVAIIVICITERESIRKSPLNFSTLNIVIEVISAYGNVGYSTGYNCEREMRPLPSCENRWYGFSGNWSKEGKAILIIIMIGGRLRGLAALNGVGAWKIF